MSSSPTRTIGPFVVGEIPPPIEYQFLDNAGTPLPLTGYDAIFTFRRNGGPPVTGNAVVDADPLTGKVTYTWSPGDLTEPGTYRGEFWVDNGANRFASLLIEWCARASVGSPPPL